MGYTRRASARRSNPAHEATGEAKFKGHHQSAATRGGATVATRSLLAEPRAPGSEATWERVKAKFSDEDQTSIYESAVAVVEASASDSEKVSGPNWRPEGEFDPQVALEVINSRKALSGAGSDGLRFSHLQSIIRTDFGREKLALVLRLSGGESSTIQAPSRRSSGSFSYNPTSQPWTENAAPFT